jgi:hypothetical protein
MDKLSLNVVLFSPFIGIVEMFQGFASHNNTLLEYYITHMCIDFTTYSRGTFNVKFGIYMHQTTIFRGGIKKCLTYFLSPYYYLIFNIYILKPPYINYNPLLHTLYFN